MVAQMYVVLLRPCRLLILRSLGLHLLLLLPCQLLHRKIPVEELQSSLTKGMATPAAAKQLPFP